MRAKVNTKECQNPFLSFNTEEDAVVYLCTPCRSKATGWQVISNPRRKGPKAANAALRFRQKRVASCNPNAAMNKCTVCLPLQTAGFTETGKQWSLRKADTLLAIS